MNTRKKDAHHLMVGSRFIISGKEYKVKEVEKANGSVYVTCDDGTTFDLGIYQEIEILRW